MFPRRKWFSRSGPHGPRNGLTGLPEDTNFPGPFGLDLLHAPLEPLLELVFVHGHCGGSRKTWSKTGNPKHFWPKAWLPRDSEFKSVRIFSFGYKSDNAAAKEDGVTLHDLGKSLLSEVSASPDIRRNETAPIVFVGHGMGGLVMKQAYIMANKDSSLKPLADRMRSMIFLATRHRVVAPSALKNSRLHITMSHKERQFISNLERDPATLKSINDQFREYSNALRLLSYYETEKTRVGVTSRFIVDKKSAALGYPHEDHVLLNGSHLDLCQFKLPSDPNFISLRNALVTIARGFMQEGTDIIPKMLEFRLTVSVPALRNEDSDDQQRSKLQDFLGLPGTPDCSVGSIDTVLWKSWNSDHS